LQTAGRRGAPEGVFYGKVANGNCGKVKRLQTCLSERHKRDPDAISEPDWQLQQAPVVRLANNVQLEPPRMRAVRLHPRVTSTERPALVADHAVATGQISQKGFEKAQ
jgi:hypothetical protein